MITCQLRQRDSRHTALGLLTPVSTTTARDLAITMWASLRPLLLLVYALVTQDGRGGASGLFWAFWASSKLRAPFARQAGEADNFRNPASADRVGSLQN